jgi:hypothetical protein
MQSKDYFKNKARKLAKQTWAGPGKFGVFIVLCIIVVATFESLGLSNREKNLEMRTVQNIVIPVNEKVTIDVEQNLQEAELQEKLKMSTEVDFQRKILERENILLYGAVEQYLFEHQVYLKNYETGISQDEKTKFFLSLILKQTDELVDSNPQDLVVFDI